MPDMYDFNLHSSTDKKIKKYRKHKDRDGVIRPFPFRNNFLFILHQIEMYLKYDFHLHLSHIQ